MVDNPFQRARPARFQRLGHPKLAGQKAQIKGQPTPEQIAQLQLFQKRQRTFSTINIYALLVAVVFMAISRYLFI